MNYREHVSYLLTVTLSVITEMQFSFRIKLLQILLNESSIQYPERKKSE